MTPIIQVVGESSSGKTTLICKLIEELKRRNYKIGVIKHTPSGIDIDKPKDSFKFYKNGAIVSVAVSGKVMQIIKKSGREKLEEIVYKYCNGVDIVFVEGYRFENYPKILTYTGDKKTSYSNVFKSIGDVFSLSQKEIKEVADMIEKKYLCKKEDIEIKIKNKKIPLNPFMQDFIKNTIVGMLKSLKGYEEGDISIKIRRK